MKMGHNSLTGGFQGMLGQGTDSPSDNDYRRAQRLQEGTWLEKIVCHNTFTEKGL